MAITEAPPLAERQIGPETQSESVYQEVIAGALELSVFGNNPERYNKFYTELKIKPVEQIRHAVNDVRFLVQGDAHQLSGSFKSRGAGNAIQNTEAKNIWMATAGNHGNGGAIACSLLDKNAFVEAGRNAAIVKLDNMRSNGARVNAAHDDVDAAILVASEKGQEHNNRFVHPFDHVDVLQGQATAGFDMLTNLLGEHEAKRIDLHKDPISLYVPIGGGGLLTGVACVFRWAKDCGLIGEQVEIIGVQMEGCDGMNRAVNKVRRGEEPTNLFPDKGPVPECDGTAVREVGERTLAIVADERFVQRIVLVSEGELGCGMEQASELFGYRIEPAGALGYTAALLEAAQQSDTICVPFVSGRNVTDETWDYFIRAADRYEHEEESVNTVTNLAERRQAVVRGVVLRQAVQPLVTRAAKLEISADARAGIEADYRRSLQSAGMYLHYPN